MTDTPDFVRLMREGTALHRAGQPERALVCFERALALQPGDSNAASACATLYTSMGQPQAAYAVLQRVEKALLQHADGATNLAIAAEAFGEMEKAQAAYQRALELDPDHPRALNNTALLLARLGDFDTAVLRLERCTELAPQDPLAWCNLADTLIAARRFRRVVEVLTPLQERMSASDALAIRRVVAQAFDGQIEEAQASIVAMGEQRLAALRDYLTRADSASAQHVRKRPARTPDGYTLFCHQAFEAIEVCDWRDHERLTAVIREMLARAARTGQGRDWRDAQFFALTLPLQEDEQHAVRSTTTQALREQAPPRAPLSAPLAGRGSTLRIGFAAPDLRDPRHVDALEQQIALHDPARFAIHVYSSTPQQTPELAARLARHGARLVEIAHMTTEEAVGRIRIDALDLFMDMAFYTPLCRPEITVRGVAPVQIRQCTWHRQHPSVNSCDYNIVDRFVLPDALDLSHFGAVVRMPHTCWLFTASPMADAPVPARSELGLPEDAYVLCALVAPFMIDPQSFALWMNMLRQLPQAVLWLPAYAPLVRRNLTQAAHAAGIAGERLVFLPVGNRAQTLSRIQCADLFVDPLRFNANHGLVDALRMGVPAVTSAGGNMASRLGGSIIRAAGLGECVLDSPKELLQTVLGLAANRDALATLRDKLASQRATAPLFDAAARVREWEWAWTEMVERQRAGKAPDAFDVPSQGAAVAATASPP